MLHLKLGEVYDGPTAFYVVDEKTILIKGFTYDGKGPDAFFWAGTSKSPSASQGTILPYPFFFFLLKIIISVIVLAMYRFVVTNLKEGWASVTWSCYVIFISCQNSKYFDLS